MLIFFCQILNLILLGLINLFFFIYRFKRNFRGAGWIFGGDVAKEFNQVNGLELVCRAHQIAMEGYQYFFDEAVCTVRNNVDEDDDIGMVCS